MEVMVYATGGAVRSWMLLDPPAHKVGLGTGQSLYDGNGAFGIRFKQVQRTQVKEMNRKPTFILVHWHLSVFICVGRGGQHQDQLMGEEKFGSSSKKVGLICWCEPKMDFLLH